jgi:hypothetical protein
LELDGIQTEIERKYLQKKVFTYRKMFENRLFLWANVFKVGQKCRGNEKNVKQLVCNKKVYFQIRFYGFINGWKKVSKGKKRGEVTKREKKKTKRRKRIITWLVLRNLLKALTDHFGGGSRVVSFDPYS